jgi:hypothetical protein
LLAEVSLIERDHAQLLASAAAAVQAGLAKVYARLVATVYWLHTEVFDAFEIRTP